MSRLLRLSTRAFTTTAARPSSRFTGPAPPRLPKEEQDLFEKLQRESTGAFMQPRETPSTANTTTTTSSRPQINQSPDSNPTSTSNAEPAAAQIQKGDEFHPNMRRGAPPEFEGDVNPKTGEVGGPKNEPLRWKGDWSYNGRVTDF